MRKTGVANQNLVFSITDNISSTDDFTKREKTNDLNEVADVSENFVLAEALCVLSNEVSKCLWVLCKGVGLLQSTFVDLGDFSNSRWS